MNKIKVQAGKLNDLLYAICMSDEFCRFCPNSKISCPCFEGTVAENNCQEALYKYLQGEEK